MRARHDGATTGGAPPDDVLHDATHSGGLRGLVVSSAPTWAVAAAILAFTLLGFAARWYSDASFVAFRQAWQLAAGHGYVWNEGEPRIDMTGAPGWVLAAAAAMKVGLDPVLFGWYAGGLAGAATLLLVYAGARRTLGLRSWWAAFPVLFLAGQSAFVAGAVGADPTRLATALTLAGTLLLARRSLSRRAAAAAGVTFFFATLLLPLSPLLHAATALGLALARPARARVLPLGTSLATHGALLVAYLAARAALFGAALPPLTTGPFASAAAVDGARFLASYPAQTHGWLWLPLLLFGLLALSARLPDMAAALLVQIAVYAAFIAARGAGGAEFQALDPLLPGLALLLAVALGAVLRMRGDPPAPRRAAILAVVAGALVAAQAATSLWPAATPTAPVLPTAAERHAQADAWLTGAQALVPFLAADDRIASISRGAVPYITRAWHAPLTSWREAAGADVLAAAVFDEFLFERPPPPGGGPRAPVVPLPDGTTIACLRLTGGARPYWIFATTLPDDALRAWAARRALEVVSISPWQPASRERREFTTTPGGRDVKVPAPRHFERARSLARRLQ